MDLSEAETRVQLIDKRYQVRHAFAHLLCASVPWFGDLSDLRYDLLESGFDLERFHAADESWPVRNRVFDLIERYIASICIDSLIVEKRKTNPVLYSIEKFYPWALGELLKYVMQGRLWQGYAQLVVITDTLPLNKREKAIRKGFQLTVPGMLPAGVTYQILHHSSQSCLGLQEADYCNWAIYRKWQGVDAQSYDHVVAAVKSKFDIFARGVTTYY